MLETQGFVNYFLIVWDFINWAREHGIPVGPGRGSAAGSIVAYAMGITDIDPLKFKLLFERFLNPERVSPPDIDVDFCQNRRGEVIDYVREKYGASCGGRAVSQIITFGTLGAKSVVRDVGRVLGLELQRRRSDREDDPERAEHHAQRIRGKEQGNRRAGARPWRDRQESRLAEGGRNRASRRRSSGVTRRCWKGSRGTAASTPPAW